MEPNLPPPRSSEAGPIQPSAELPKPPVYETVPSTRPEHLSSPEQGNRELQPSGGPAPLPMRQQPVQQQGTSAAVVTAVQDDDTPPTAKDEDLIEKEWVDKAKKVIAQTRHDPYTQQKAVSRLQAAYLQKRYGKTIKLPADGK